MIQTSAAYKTAIKSDTELVEFEAEFGFIPPGAVGGSVLSANSQAIISDIAQIKNGTRNMGSRWNSLELNRTILNGKNDWLCVDGRQIGLQFGNVCDENGAFSQNPTVTYTFDKTYDLIGIAIYFDAAGAEYAENFTVEYFNASKTLIKALTIANRSTYVNVDLPQKGVKSFTITITKWCVPCARAKICQVLPGQIYLFTSENSYEFVLNESVSLFDTSLKLPQFSIAFDDVYGKFDIVNPQGLATFLREKMKIKSKLKLLVSDKFENINTGEFYLKEWDLTETETTKFTCTPGIATFNTIYKAPANTGTQTAAQACAAIFSGTSEIYSVDAEIANISVNKYIGEDVPLVNAMGQLAVACCGYWKFERDGSYSLKKWNNTNLTAARLTYDEMYQKPKISQTDYYTSVNVKFYVSSEFGGELSFKSYDCITQSAVNEGTMKTITSAFVPSEAAAKIIGAKALEYFQLRLQQSINYRGNMAIEAADFIIAQNDYSEIKGIITSNDITWNENGLAGSMKLIGAHNVAE